MFVSVPCFVNSIAPNAASPLIGFGDVPFDSPVSLIDFHGLLDRLPMPKYPNNKQISNIFSEEYES